MNASDTTELFPRFDKIAESMGAWNVDAKAHRALQKARWAVTEKIHGANFCLFTDGQNVRAANRREWLTDEHEFWGWQSVRDTHKSRIAYLWDTVQTAYDEVEAMYVYGELFGGSYPHPDVAPVPDVRPVQTGVWYAPDIRFCAFDIRLTLADSGFRFLDFDDATRRLKAADIFCAEPLFEGTYQKAADFPIRFDSTIPRRLGMPPLPTGTNLAEGVVIRPLREITLETAQSVVRPLLKRKIAEFAEDKRFHEAEKETSAPVYNGALDLLKWEAYNRITVNRWQATLSKTGDGPRERADAFTLFCAEVDAEARAATPGTSAFLRPGEAEVLAAYIRDEAALLIGF